MREILKQIGAHLRVAGYRGSGQNYYRVDGDFAYFVNIQGSRWGDAFFVNLGAQPAFMPTNGWPVKPGDAPPSTLREHDCVFRRRVGDEWPWEMDSGTLAFLIVDVLAAQAALAARVSGLAADVVTGEPRQVVADYAVSTTEARMALHLARAAVALGHPDRARAFVALGYALAGERAEGLREDLERVVEG